ncbi:MAG: HNH endonuclease [Rubrobacteraceae bacterium]|nr:HNH endonuclease [Rubrobacteraceae bacterium]
MYTVHGEKCYMCGEPIDLLTMEVDHIIPESLLGDPTRLAKILADYDLSASFDLQSFANWLPACRTCNNRKRSRVFNPSPLIQIQLQIAEEKAPQVAALAIKRVSAQAASRAWNTIKRAAAVGHLSESIASDILEFASFHASRRASEVASEPMQLTPLIQVLSEKDGIRVLKGPYGVGGGPIGPSIHSSFYCSTCGSAAWNGARCVVCGQMDDD